MFITALTLYLLSDFYHLKDCRSPAMPTHFSFYKFTYRWQVSTLPTSESHRHFMTEFSPKSRSIIITDMLHRPAQLLRTLSGFSRSMPLPQCHVRHSLTLTPALIRSRHIMAHLHSGCTYPHVLYVMQYSVFNLATIPVYKHHTSEGHVPRFFYILPLPYHTFFEPFLLNDCESVVVRLIAVHNRTPPPSPCFVYMG